MDNCLVMQIERFDKALPQLGQVMQRSAQKGNISPDWPAAGQA